MLRTEKPDTQGDITSLMNAKPMKQTMHRLQSNHIQCKVDLGTRKPRTVTLGDCPNTSIGAENIMNTAEATGKPERELKSVAKPV